MSYNILIVDDSSIVRKTMIKTFGMTDLAVGQILQAENGQIALNILKENWVDIVFLDINMPVMDGMEFMKHLVADEELKRTPVVVVSTEGSQERIDELSSRGIKAYLRKPVTPECLVETITGLLGAS